MPKLSSKINLNEKAAMTAEIVQGIMNIARNIPEALTCCCNNTEINKPIQN